MSINILPDDCWLTIFDNFTSLDDIINTSKVCSKWESLIARRCAKIKCLKAIAAEDDPVNTVYFGRSYGLNALELNKLLPNLQTLQIDPSEYGCKVQCFIDGNASSYPSIKGIIYTGQDLSSILRFPNIEMVACRKMTLTSGTDAQHLTKLKQLHVKISESLITVLKTYSNRETNFLCNLKRLQVANFFIPAAESNSLSEIFVLSNLKILELSSTNDASDQSKPDVFSFMDYCTSLESAFLSITSIGYNFYFNPLIIHTELRDLVIEKARGPQFGALSFSWNALKQFFKKCPNLKHLAIRNSPEMTDDTVKELLDMLPKIELLDLRRCNNITARSVDYVKNFSLGSGRSIVLHYGRNFPLRETQYYPLTTRSSQKLCYSFNFMKHCFFCTFDQLPVLMIP